MRYSCLLQPLVVSLFLSFRIHSCLFSGWRCAVSSKFFDTQVPLVSTEERVVPRRTCVLSRLCGTVTVFCETFIYLELAKSRIQLAAPATIRPRTHLISFCAVQLRTLCATRSSATLSLRPLARPCVVARIVGLHGLLRCL